MIWWISVLMNYNAAVCTPIRSDQILAADLSRSIPEFAAAPRDAVIGYAPVPGSRRTFHASELKRLAMKFDVRLASSDRQACFEWQLRSISREDVTSAMRESLALADPAIDGAHIEILEIGTRVAPLGKIVFPLTGLIPAADRKGPALWRGYIVYAEKRRFDFWARVKLSAPTTRVVAVASIATGHTIESSDVRLETVEDFPISHDTVRHLDEVVGRVARRGIPSGRTVLRADLARPLEIEAGEIVEVDVASGKTHLTMQGRAENSGHTGDVISIRNQRSGKLFRARVEAKGRVLVMPGVTGGMVN